MGPAAPSVIWFWNTHICRFDDGRIRYEYFIPRSILGHVCSRLWSRLSLGAHDTRHIL